MTGLNKTRIYPVFRGFATESRVFQPLEISMLYIVYNIYIIKALKLANSLRSLTPYLKNWRIGIGGKLMGNQVPLI